MKKRADRYPLFQRLSPGGADVSGVTATAPDVDEGKIFVDNTGEQVVGTSTYKADYIALSGNIDDLNEDLEEVITGDGTGGGLTVDSVKGLIDGTATTFTIPDGVTSIYQYRFHEMDTLRHVDLPDTITQIGTSAFSRCNNLELTSLPSSLAIMGSYAFSDSSKIALTSLPSGLTSIPSFAFANCTRLALTSLPSGLTSIAGSAFTGCTSLTEITFLGTPTSISYSAFLNCTNLTTIRVPWQEGEVANAPWGAANSSIIYGYTPS